MAEKTMEPIIEFKHVSKRYKLYSGNRQRLASVFFKNLDIKTKDAVNDMSFSVMPGESVALVGSNGAGKSTVLKMITGVCFPTEGEVTVNGRVSALLELTAGFEGEMTGRENIYLRGTTLGLSQEEIKELEPEIVEFADIGEYMDQPVRSYSSGMKARLGFAINANVHPEILIVDEALSVGDKSFKEKCLDKVRQLIADDNVTLLLVTHNANTAKQFCERGIFIQKGTIKYDGPIEEAVGRYEKELKKKKKKKKEAKALEAAAIANVADAIKHKENDMKTTLVIMAAGIGSRFGTGIKQMESVGPSGELIIDYSIHDAIEAGFNKIVFVIRKDLDKDFREIIGNRTAEKIDVAYAYQDLNDLPEGFTAGERTKPWGTGQAVLACRGIVDGPFAIINADDYYGKEAFVQIHDFLQGGKASVENGVQHLCMAGFQLKNTLSDNGTVTRGVCEEEDGLLTNIVETHNIEKLDGRAAVRTETNITYYDDETPVSMNMWGLPADFIGVLEERFPEFLKNIPEGDLKAEFLIPVIIGELIGEGKADCVVLPTSDKWFGMTYKEDIPTVKDAFKDLVANGVYPENIK